MPQSLAGSRKREKRAWCGLHLQKVWLRWSVWGGRSKDDFKHLCRKITHTIMEKEQKHNAASLSFDDQTKRKIAKFIKEFFVRNPPLP